MTTLTTSAAAAAVERLYVSSLDSKPVTVDSWSHLFQTEAEDGVLEAEFWETFTYEHDEAEYLLLAETGLVRGVILDGTLYRDYDVYADAWRDEHEGDDETDAEALTEREWDDLMEIDPAQWGSEGPMMNYWYPVISIDGEDDAAAAALAIGEEPLCVVRVGSAYGLALTGGGMDLSWEICRAFIATGNLPPVHFADLPRFAGDQGDRLVVAAMTRALTWTIDHAQHRLAQLSEHYPS